MGSAYWNYRCIRLLWPYCKLLCWKRHIFSYIRFCKRNLNFWFPVRSLSIVYFCLSLCSSPNLITDIVVTFWFNFTIATHLYHPYIYIYIMSIKFPVIVSGIEPATFYHVPLSNISNWFILWLHVAHGFSIRIRHLKLFQKMCPQICVLSYSLGMRLCSDCMGSEFQQATGVSG